MSTGERMLTDYINAAMRKARYKLLEGDEGVFGEIPGFSGLWANESRIDDCRESLRQSLEAWLMVKLRHNDNDLPRIGGINLNERKPRKSKVA